MARLKRAQPRHGYRLADPAGNLVATRNQKRRRMPIMMPVSPLSLTKSGQTPRSSSSLHAVGMERTNGSKKKSPSVNGKPLEHLTLATLSSGSNNPFRLKAGLRSRRADPPRV